MIFSVTDNPYSGWAVAEGTTPRDAAIAYADKLVAAAKACGRTVLPRILPITVMWKMGLRETFQIPVNCAAEMPECRPSSGYHTWTPHPAQNLDGVRGVHPGQNGGLMIHDYCPLCGLERIIETRVADPATGQIIPADVVKYFEPPR